MHWYCQIALVLIIAAAVAAAKSGIVATIATTCIRLLIMYVNSLLMLFASVCHIVFIMMIHYELKPANYTALMKVGMAVITCFSK